MPAPTRTSSAVPAHLKGNADGLKYRFDQYYKELCLRRGGTPHHPAMLSDPSETPAELAIDCIALAKAYIEAEERNIAEGVYRR